MPTTSMAMPLGIPAIRGAARWMTVVLVAASVLVAVVKPLGPWVLLAPALVLQGYVWQLLSYTLVENSPIGVLFGAWILWSVGGDLERTFGLGRFLRFLLGVVGGAALATVLLSLAWTQLQGVAFYGGGAVTTSLLVAFGLSRPNAQLNFFGMAMTGRGFALLAAAFVGLNAAFAGLGAVVPDLFALLFTWFASKGYGPGDLWTRLRTWQLSRKLKTRSSHLNIVSSDARNMPKDSDRYLH